MCRAWPLQSMYLAMTLRASQTTTTFPAQCSARRPSPMWASQRRKLRRSTRMWMSSPPAISAQPLCQHACTVCIVVMGPHGKACHGLPQKCRCLFTSSYKCAARGLCTHAAIILPAAAATPIFCVLPEAGQLLVVQWGRLSQLWHLC